MKDEADKKDGFTIKFNVIKKRGSKCVSARLLADYEKGTLKMIDHQSEWNGGYNPTTDGHPLTNQKSTPSNSPLIGPNLPVGNNPVSNSQGYNPTSKIIIPKSGVQEAYKKSEQAETIVSVGPKKCMCPIRELMAYGCQCGGK